MKSLWEGIMLSGKLTLLQSVLSSSEFKSAAEVLNNDPEILSNANKVSFLSSARAAFNKFGFDIPKGKEESFIIAYEAMSDKKYEDVEEFRTVDAATEPSIFIAAVSISQSVYDSIKDMSGMEKADELLKRNISEGNKSNEYMVARNGKAYPVIDEYVVENLVRIDTTGFENR
jgi:hypothetical protein